MTCFFWQKSALFLKRWLESVKIMANSKTNWTFFSGHVSNISYRKGIYFDWKTLSWVVKADNLGNTLNSACIMNARYTWINSSPCPLRAAGNSTLCWNIAVKLISNVPRSTLTHWRTFHPELEHSRHEESCMRACTACGNFDPQNSGISPYFTAS